MGPNTAITYELGPVVSLAEKVGFDGNEVVHVSTESSLDEAPRASAGRPSAPPTTPTPGNPDPDGDGLVEVCHMPGTGAENNLVVSVLSIAAHLGHGDQFGTCT